MKFIWGKTDSNSMNVTLAFCLRKRCAGGVLRLYASNTYRVFADGRLKSTGPERTAAGYAKERLIDVGDASSLVVEVAAYGICCYSHAYEPPFFAAELVCEGSVEASSDDFECRELTDRLRRVPRLSYQRGFIEHYVMPFDKSEFYAGNFALYPARQTVEVSPPECLPGSADSATYRKIEFAPLRTGSAGINESLPCPPAYSWWEDFAGEGKTDGFAPSELEADLVAEISRIDYGIDGALRFAVYGADRVQTGLIDLRVRARTDCTVYAVFDEIDGGSGGKADVAFCRPVFHNAAAWRLSAGSHRLLTFEPYDLAYLKVTVDGDAEITYAGLVEIANKEAVAEIECGDSKISAVFEAGKNSFCQNAVDIFTDCPGRERAGWLCDSYFTARAEQLLTGKNTVERHFLNNFILAREDNLPRGMLPMCYPARQRDGTFIPNWAMWYVAELYEYYLRTGDGSLVCAAKGRVYELIAYFDAFVGEEGLLEDLDGWVFLEWSEANDDKFTRGVNFPSNMLYAHMLTCASELYGDDELLRRAEAVKRTVAEQSYNGEFFVDNAVRKDGKLVCTQNISETCQYYALFCTIECDAGFRARMLNEFGPNRAADKYAYVCKSSVFIGNYLRLLWLIRSGEYSVARRECIDFFYYMAQRSGTLWEYQSTEASCNHGFTSVVCAFIAEFLFGYRGFFAVDKTLVFSRDFCKDTDARITLPVGTDKLTVELRGGKRTVAHTTDYRIVIE